MVNWDELTFNFLAMDFFSNEAISYSFVITVHAIFKPSFYYKLNMIDVNKETISF